MLFAFIILVVVANSGLIYADNTINTTENLSTQSADDLPVDSVNTTENSSDNIINTESNTENINNIDQTENQTNNESTSSSSNDSNSEIDEISDNSDYNDSLNNNSEENIPEEVDQTNNNSLSTDSQVLTNNSESSSNEDINATLAAGSDSSKFSKNDILSAATELKKYVEKYGKLPDYLTLCGEKLSMSDFLYLLAKIIVNTNSGNNGDITSKDVKDPTSPSGSATNGQLSKSNYLNLAKRIVSFIETNNRAPNYGSSTLGNIQFQTLVYGFSKIIDFYKNNNRLPNYVTFVKKTSTTLNSAIPKYTGSNGLIVSGSSSGSTNTTGNSSGNTGGSNSSSSGTVSLANMKDAGARIEAFVNANGVLPNYVEINGKQYSMTDFLYLAAAAIVNINKGITSDITVKSFTGPSNPTGSSINGNIYKSDFVDLASRVLNYMLKNGNAPNYGSSTLGNMQFQTLVLGFSKILEFAKTEGRLPNYLTLNIKSTATVNGGSGGSSSSGSIPDSILNSKYNGESLAKYLSSSTNCQSTAAAIKSLATSLTKSCTTELEKATAIFNYVRDNIAYNFYYNTKYGATGTLSKKVGNCVDQSHLLVAMLRASGIAARYGHGKATFTSGSTYGHVWVQVLIGDTWVVADTTSSKK